MPNYTAAGTLAVRLQTLAESLSDPDDRALARDYLRELEMTAREQAEEDRRKGDMASGSVSVMMFGRAGKA